MKDTDGLSSDARASHSVAAALESESTSEQIDEDGDDKRRRERDRSDQISFPLMFFGVRTQTRL